MRDPGPWGGAQSSPRPASSPGVVPWSAHLIPAGLTPACVAMSWSFQVCVPSCPALEEARGADTEEYRGLARSSREGNEPSLPDMVRLTEGDAFASEGPLHLDSSAAWGQGLCPPREAFCWTLCRISAETYSTLRQWTKHCGSRTRCLRHNIQLLFQLLNGRRP